MPGLQKLTHILFLADVESRDCITEEVVISGTRVPRGHVIQSIIQSKLEEPGLIVVGVPWSPCEFMDVAAKLDHPFSKLVIDEKLI